MAISFAVWCLMRGSGAPLPPVEAQPNVRSNYVLKNELSVSRLHKVVNQPYVYGSPGAIVGWDRKVPARSSNRCVGLVGKSPLGHNRCRCIGAARCGLPTLAATVDRCVSDSSRQS